MAKRKIHSVEGRLYPNGGAADLANAIESGERIGNYGKLATLRHCVRSARRWKLKGIEPLESALEREELIEATRLSRRANRGEPQTPTASITRRL